MFPFGSRLPAQRCEQAGQLGLQGDVVEQQHRQHETCGAESVDPADIKAEIDIWPTLKIADNAMSNSQAHSTTISQTSITECGRRNHSTSSAARLSNHTADTTPIMAEV